VKEQVTHTAELRHIAVLFADLQGYSRLCERLDPEEVVETLDAIYERLGVEVERYGGHVDKVLGDGLLVLFGAPQAHEDDGLRAVLAGLAMQKAMSDLQPWLRERLGQNLGLRVGIDAGAVVYGEVGPGARAHVTVIGDAVNVASRLQRVAAPGQVVLGERARRLASRRIQFRKLGAVQLEGRAASVEAYVAVAPFAPMATSQTAPIVGRSAELQRLMTIYGSVTTGKTALVLLTGEAGIGKSRLLSELATALQVLEPRLQPTVLHVRNRWEVGSAYRPFEGLVAAMGGRGRVAGDEAGRLATLSARLGRVEAMAGGDPGAAAATLAEIGKGAPVVVLVDDWQWADAAETRKVLQLAREAASQRVLFVLCGRRVELAGGVDVSDVSVNRLRLAPMKPRESWMLLQQHPAFSALPLELAESVLERGGGNPAHVIECIESLIENGQLTPSGDGWRAKEDQAAFRVPETMRNDILSRLDALEAGDRHLMRVCAVSGRRIHTPLLAEVTGEPEQTVRQRLYGLVEAGLIVTGTPPEESYTFRSELVREVAYDTMLRRQRRELHLLLGETLEKHGGASGEVLAVHFGRSGVPDKAANYALSASQSLLARGEHREALQLLAEAEHFIAAEDTERRATLLERLGEALVASGSYIDGVDKLLQALALVRDPVWRGRLMAELGWAYSLQGRVELAAKHYRRAHEAISTVGDREQEALIAAANRLLYDRP